MSSGQKPRVRALFPRMKVRRPHRRRPWMIVLYDAQWNPLWLRRGKRNRARACAMRIVPGDGQAAVWSGGAR